MILSSAHFDNIAKKRIVKYILLHTIANFLPV